MDTHHKASLVHRMNFLYFLSVDVWGYGLITYLHRENQ